MKITGKVLSTDELVKGVWLTRTGEAMEQSKTDLMVMNLIASWDGTEVIRQEIPAGKRFGLRPEEGWGALEVLYVLHGSALWAHSHQTLTLGPGDSVRGTPVKEPYILEALTDLIVLYICSQPVFHMLSDEIVRYREMAVTVELKDGHTADHCERIQALSAKVGSYLDISPTRQHYLLLGAFFHDIGKVKIPDSVLKKPGALTPEEWLIMKQHPVLGRQIVDPTFMAGAGFILEQHHERLDGSGYPYGLAGDAIPLESQIVAVVDSFDAMTSDRIYRKGMPTDQAVSELRQGIGSLYRADVVEALLRVLDT